ncbi:MAG: GIY-YIG nuclease family protein [Candidatus Absconditabacterales bacterium]
MRYVYILRCKDKTLYTGITNDTEKRLHDHNNSTCGARYTKSRRPVKLIWKKRMKDRVAAMKMEYKVKRLSRARKEELVEGRNRRGSGARVRKACLPVGRS